jgi:fructokinase
VLAGVELGGTKCICVLGTGPDDLLAQEHIATTGPVETLDKIEAVVGRWAIEHGPVAALGIASFGPLDLNTDSPRYGRIISTVKPGWGETDVVGRLSARIGGPVGFNTDVNGAALAEGRWGRARGLSNFAYVTVGTGIGVGLTFDGRPIFGINHTELGHIRVARIASDTWPGCCPFHGDCLEGLASGPAIRARTGEVAERVAADHPVWESVAFSLGQLLHTLVLTAAPSRILMGGGVMHGQNHLFSRIRDKLRLSLNGYIEAEELHGGILDYVCPPGLGANAGPLGALALAHEALATR